MIPQSNKQFDRHDRVKSMLSEVVAAFIRQEANHNPLITVTGLTVSPNYRDITVLFTTIPDGKEEDALIFLKRKGGDLRAYIKKHSHMKIIPFVDFAVDYGERHRQHIDTIAQKIEKKETT